MSRRGVRSRPSRPVLTVVPGGIPFPPASRPPQLPPRTLAVAGARPGVGRSSLAANLALALADLDRRVLVIAGSGKVERLLQAGGAADLHPVLCGTGPVEGVPSSRGAAFLSVVPVDSGHDPGARERLIGAFLHLAPRFDYVILDLPAGPGVPGIARRAEEMLVITTPGTAACTDAATLTAALPLRRPARLVVNRARNRADAREAFVHVARIAAFHPAGPPRLLGHVPDDPAIGEATRLRRSFVLSRPGSPGARHLRELALRILGEETPGGDDRVLHPGSSRPSRADRAQAA